MENYILEGLAPLKRYLSISHRPEDQDHEEEINILDDCLTEDGGQEDGGILDWGIDLNENDISSPTLINDFAANSTFEMMDKHGRESDVDDMEGVTPFVEDKFHDWGISPKKQKKFSLANIIVHLKEKLRDQSLKDMAFLDEFRYILVTSQLLDETILVSKFAQRRKKSLLDLKMQNWNVKNYGHLITMNSNFQIKSLIQDIKILNIIGLLKHIYKNQHKYSLHQIRLVLIISLISLTFIIKSKIIKLQILQNKILNQLKNSIKTFQKFDISIQKLITNYKEIKVYHNIIPNKPISGNPDTIYDLIISSLNLSTNSINNVCKLLLPFTNGSELENYCGIYNIEITELGFGIEQLKPLKMDLEDPIDLITSKFKKFQLLRRFLIVILLATNQLSVHSPFLNKIFGIFNIDKKLESSLLLKLMLISNNLETLQQLCLNLNKSIEQSTTLLNTTSISDTPTKSGSVDLLLNKIKEFELQLVLLRRSNDPNQLKELGITLENLTKLYNKEYSSLQYQQSEASVLKIEKQRKRFSLPTNTNYSIPIQIQQQRSKSTSHKSNYKRLSTGFTLPLLTVTEEEEITPQRAVSYDDNYLNIMPSNDSFAKEEDHIDNYIQQRNLLSNDDSVIVTNNEGGDDDFNDDDSTVFDNEVLKQKLEMNFAKMIQGDRTIVKEDEEDYDNVVNLNNQQIGKRERIPLMDELRATLNK